MFKKEVKETEMGITDEIMILHRYLKKSEIDDVYQCESSVPDEFLANIVYTCEIIMTNATP